MTAGPEKNQLQGPAATPEQEGAHIPESAAAPDREAVQDPATAPERETAGEEGQERTARQERKAAAARTGLRSGRTW